MSEKKIIQLEGVKAAKEKKRYADMVLGSWDDQQHARDRIRQEQKVEVERKARGKL
ncbi:MAG: hypothetical protein KGL35_17330 [Bradyrhizobium sp.]|nr:hypothetical protein [Bradyrhizobium sp.]